MPITFILKKIVALLITPPVLPILLILAGLILLKYRPRAGRVLAWSGLLLTIFLSTPASVGLLADPLEDYPTISENEIAQAQAIVILGGGQRRRNPEYDGAPSVNRLTLERVRFGAQLARASKLPILVSGGAPTGVTPEGVLMDRALRTDFGTSAKWIEDASLDTADNARYSAALLKNAGITRIALVTHALHMRRAVGEFQASGMQVVPAPMGFMGNGPGGEEFFDFVPGNSSAYTGWYAVHEWLGIIEQKLRFTLHR